MIKIKRMLCLVLSAVMLSGVLSVSVSAGQAEIYETGSSYYVDGVEYYIEESGTVTVIGEAPDGAPERAEILSELGGYKVTAIGVGAFYKCEALKEVVIPETVTTVSRLAFEHSGLTDIEIKGKNVSVSSRFRETPYRADTDNWINENILKDVFVVSGYAVEAYVRGAFVLSEDIVGIGEQCFTLGCNGMTKLTVLNPDCHIFDAEDMFPSHVTLCGYRGSTVQEYAERYDYNFSAICDCEGTVFVPATYSYCDGTVGYGDGYWCEHCGAYASGGAVDTSFEHKDADADGICDLCGEGTDSEITKAGQCGNSAVWTLGEDGTLRISGTTGVYSDYYYTATDEPWYGYKDEIKHFVAEDGIRGLYSISFRDYTSLETVTLAESVLSLPKSFQGCTALREINIPRSVSDIPYSCFEGCVSLESIYIPKNVTAIGSSAFYKCTNLSDIDFETGYVKIDSYAFFGTAAYNNPDNVRDGILYIGSCLIKEFTPGATSIVLGPEITAIASGWKHLDSLVTELSVYNPDCAFALNSSVASSTDLLRGYAGSTAQKYRQSFGGKFEYLAPHTCTEVVDIPAVAPTADKPGYTHLSHCSVCGETVSKRVQISADEYEITVRNGVITAKKTEAATAEADGTDITITFAVENDICLSSIEQTVIYKVGEVKLAQTEFVYNGRVQKPGVTVKDSKGNLLTKGTDYTVTYPQNPKYSGRYAVEVEYIGNYAGGKTLYYDIVIEAINPTVSASGSDSITLSWEKGHSDLVYRVYSVGADGRLTKIDDTVSDSYEVAALEADTQYSFVVRAYVKDGNGTLCWGEEGEAVEYSTEPAENNVVIRLLMSIFRYVLKILISIM